MEKQVIEAALAAIGSTYGKKAAEFSSEQIKMWFSKASRSIGDSKRVDSAELEKLADSILVRESGVIDTEITKRNLARWFEVPLEEFEMTPKEQLEPEVLIRHIYLERTFESWLKEWGYEVRVGEDLEGRESIDFTPDVYGVLKTLHGEFEICVNFVCDYPPSQYRVRALLETLESYATKKSEFRWNDLYIVATPYQFGRGSASSLRLQSKEEDYTVVKLESEDLSNLSRAGDKGQRKRMLMEHVERANALGPARDAGE